MSCSIPTADRKTAPQSTTSFNLDEENSPNVAFGLLVPAVVIGMARPSALRLLVAGQYVGLTALTFLLAWVGRGLGRASRIEKGDHRGLCRMRGAPTGALAVPAGQAAQHWCEVVVLADRDELTV
jgi:hypothetical protein